MRRERRKQLGRLAAWVGMAGSSLVAASLHAACGGRTPIGSEASKQAGDSSVSGETWVDRTWKTAGWGLPWTDVASDSTGTHLVAVTTSAGAFPDGNIWTSSDSGATWTNRTQGTQASGQRWSSVASDSTGAHLIAIEGTPAVVVSQAQNEVEGFKRKGLDIAPHRLRMVKEDLDTKFKDPKDPFGLVFVCAMWMTGFDVPTCGAVYLDKPMRNHTLMQTIARANRVYEGKVNGLIVDYVGVFRNLQKALAIYGAGAGGGVGAGDTPVQPKEVQLEELKKLIAEGKKFCADAGVDVDAIRSLTKLARITALKAGVDKLIHPADTKKKYLTLATQADRLCRALGLDEAKLELAADWGALLDLARGIRGLEQPVDISGVMARVEELLDESIDAEGYVIREPQGEQYGGRIHLGEIDFEALARYFAKAKNRASTVEALTSSATRRVNTLVRLNPTRRSLRDKLEALIQDYNLGAHSVGEFFGQLMAFIKEMEAAEGRASGEGVSQEQLAFYDLLAGVEVELSKKDQAAVKKVATALPKAVEKKRVIDWRKSQMKRAAVRVAIKGALKDLPEVYDEVKFEAALAAVYEHVYESYWGDGKSLYVEAPS
jgi:type I restriction enzyme R subunit